MTCCTGHQASPRHQEPTVIETADATSTTQARTYSAPALDKGLDILELLAGTELALSQKEIARLLNRSVGEIYRMLACLVGRNYVGMAGESYHLTSKMFELAQKHPPMQRLLIEARPIMQGLSGALDQSCHLTIYGRGRQIVVEKVDVSSGMGFSVSVGSELELLVSVSGRVLLAFQDAETRKLWIQQAVQRQPQEIDPQINTLLDFIAARGYESAPSSQVRGLYAVSCPILDTQGHAIAALTVPYADRIDLAARKSIQDVEQELQDAALRVSERIAGKRA